MADVLPFSPPALLPDSIRSARGSPLPLSESPAPKTRQLKRARDDEQLPRNPPRKSRRTKKEQDDDEKVAKRRSVSASPPPEPAKVQKASGSSTPRAKNFPCPYDGCTKAFVRPSRRDEHIRSTHTHERRFPCEYEGCDKAFYRKSHLEVHVRQTHTKDLRHVCDYEGCQAAFATGQRLKVHKDHHERQLHCPYEGCEMIFRKKGPLQRHVEKQHLENALRCGHNKSGTDEVCGEVFAKGWHLRRHETDVHGIPHYWCNICVDLAEAAGDGNVEAPGFATYTQLVQHNRDVHPPMCQECNMTFINKHELGQHNLVHHSGLTPAERSVCVCPIEGCGKGFTKPYNLKVHIQSVHDKITPFVCGEVDNSNIKELEGWDGSNACYEGFKAKKSYKDHVARFHYKDGNYLYPEDKKFKLRSRQVKRKGKDSVSLAGLLTDGQGEGSGRDIPCIFADCEWRFAREYDLEQHLGSGHDLNEYEVAEALAERQALQGGKFWIGGVEQEEEEWHYRDMRTQQEFLGAAADRPTAQLEPFRFIASGGLDR